MDSDAKAKLQVRLLVVMYRQHIQRGGPDGAAEFRERALPILRSVEVAHGNDLEVAQLLSDASRELGAARD